MNNIIDEQELYRLCRLCLRRDEEFVDVFKNLENSNQPMDTSLSAKIMACVSIEISPNDRGPKKICSKCLANVNSWHEFKLSCELARNILNRYLSEMEEEKKLILPEKIITSEDSILFPEISLFSCDTFMDRSVSVTSNISSIVNYFLSTEKSKENKIEAEVKNDINFTKEIERHNLEIANQPSNPEESHHLEEINNFPSSEENKPKGKNKKGYECGLCDQHFTHFSVLLTHDDTSHSTVPRNYSCSMCARLFPLQKRLDMHTRLHHRQKLFQCPICDKFFVSEKSLKVHSRLHSEMYKCEICGFLSTSKKYLNQHVQKHEGADMVFTCDICRKKFSQKSSLIRHQKLHSENHGKCFKCPICHILFRSHSELLSHKISHSEPKKYGNYKCKTCDKTYKSKNALKMHIKVHESPFTCLVCEKKLKSNYDLGIHLETHSNSKTFDCFHCENKFSFKSTLRRHIKKHYPRIRSDLRV